MTTTEAPTRTYTPVQQAARDYMTAKKVVDAIKSEAKPHEDAMKAALNTLAAEYPAERKHEHALHVINGVWNVPLTFLHRTDDSTKWQKVAEGLLPLLTPAQEDHYRRLMDTHTGERTTKTLKA
jgi:hypothetical protein